MEDLEDHPQSALKGYKYWEHMERERIEKKVKEAQKQNREKEQSAVILELEAEAGSIQAELR